MADEEKREVFRGRNRGWIVKNPRQNGVSSYHEHRSLAIERATDLLEQAGGGVVVVHDRSGVVVEKRAVEPADRPLTAT